MKKKHNKHVHVYIQQKILIHDKLLSKLNLNLPMTNFNFKYVLLAMNQCKGPLCRSTVLTMGPGELMTD